MLVLGIWWRQLTAVGVIAGLAVGGSLSMTAVLATMVGIDADGVLGAILTQPAAVTVPAAFATMIGRPRRGTAAAPRRADDGAPHAPEHLILNRGPSTPRGRQHEQRPDRVTARR